MVSARVLPVVSQMLRILGILLLAPAAVGLAYGEFVEALVFLLLAFALILPFSFVHHFVKYEKPKVRHAMAGIAFSWLAFGVIGALPLWSYGLMHPGGMFTSPVDCLFESFSGWSGTGLSILRDPSSLPHALNFWRCFMQWAGGLGFVVMAVLMFERPATTGALFAAEGRTEDFTLNFYAVGRRIMKIYLALSIIATALFMAAGLGLFDAVVHMMSILSTGGFSSNAVGIGYYGTPAALVAILVMIMGGISFMSHHMLFTGRIREFFRNPEVRFLFILISLASLAIGFDVYAHAAKAGPVSLSAFFGVNLFRQTEANFLDGMFYASSALSGAGAALHLSPAAFPQMSICVLILLMIFGACYGSTTSALKLWRVILLYKVAIREARRIMFPHGTQIPVRVSGFTVPDEAVLTAVSYTIMYLALLALGSFAVMSIGGYGALDSVFLVASAQGNVGISTVDVPALPAVLKLLLAFHMYAGRIEILPLLVLSYGIFKPKRV